MKKKIQTKICDALEGKKDYGGIIRELSYLESIVRMQKQRLRSARNSDDIKISVLELAMQLIIQHMDKIYKEIERLK